MRREFVEHTSIFGGCSALASGAGHALTRRSRGCFFFTPSPSALLTALDLQIIEIGEILKLDRAIEES